MYKDYNFPMFKGVFTGFVPVERITWEVIVDVIICHLKV